MIYGVTAADSRMKASARVCHDAMLSHGCSTVDVISLFGHGRGAGYWRWMPEAVVTTIQKAMDGGYDFVVYCDAGVQVLRSIRHITDRMAPTDHVFLFGNEHSHEHWCKADVNASLGWIGSEHDRQVQASVHVWRATREALEIAKAWDKACDPITMIDDSPSTLPNHPRFVEHRHPQAVLTIIAKRHGIPLHWWPSEYGLHIKHRYKVDTYPQLFNHHRRRDPGTNEPNQPEWTLTEYAKIMEI